VRACAICIFAAAAFAASACGGGDDKTHSREEVQRVFADQGLELRPINNFGEDAALFAPANPDRNKSFRVVVWSDVDEAETQAERSRIAAQTVPELSALTHLRQENVVVEYDKTQTQLDQKLRAALDALK
jgi:hypothetical protein